MALIASLLVLGLFYLYFENSLQARNNPNRNLQIAPGAELTLQRGRDGHYVFPGEINGKPVTFLLDTGATLVSVPAHLAGKLELEPGAHQQSMSPVEVGASDYPSGGPDCCAHDAKPSPSGAWVYLEDEIGVGGSGGVRVLDASRCDGTTYCTPTEVGFWHINGHPVQAAAYHGRGWGSWHGVVQRFFTWDAHNLDVQGENTLLVANYTMGVRLIDKTDKTSPVETSFYLPNANKSQACTGGCFFQGRETWGAYFGSDGLIYASDFWLGFFILRRAAGRFARRGARR